MWWLLPSGPNAFDSIYSLFSSCLFMNALRPVVAAAAAARGLALLPPPTQPLPPPSTPRSPVEVVNLLLLPSLPLLMLLPPSSAFSFLFRFLWDVEGQTENELQDERTERKRRKRRRRRRNRRKRNPLVRPSAGWLPEEAVVCSSSFRIQPDYLRISTRLISLSRRTVRKKQRKRRRRRRRIKLKCKKGSVFFSCFLLLRLSTRAGGDANWLDDFAILAQYIN